MRRYSGSKMKPQRIRTPQERYYRDDDFYVARQEDDRQTLVAKSREVLRTYPLVKACVLLFLFAFVFRAAYNLNLGNYAISPELRDMYDYDQVARSLVDGQGYARPWAFTDDRGETVIEIRTTMFRPPLYVVALASAYAVGDRNPLIARILLSSIGATTVVAIFLVTRKLFTTRIAAIAGIVAAVYPPLIAADGVLYPEALFTCIAVLLVYAMLLLREKPALYRAIITGVLVGALALTRAEGAAWLILPIVFIAFSIPRVSRARKAALAALVAATAFVIYIPWLHHTWSNFRTIAPSSSLGSMTVGANNRVAYYDRIYTGSWYYGGLVRDRATLYEIRDPRHNEKTVDDLYLAQGLEYARSHLERVPTVVAARLLRAFDFWDPYITARLEEGWGRPTWITYAGLAFYFPLLATATYAAWRSRRRWREFLPLYVIFAGFILFSAASFGSSRFRLTADAAMIIFSSSVLYGLTRTPVIKRKASLRDLLDQVDLTSEEQATREEIPEEVLRAMRIRAMREELTSRLQSGDLARLHEGEDVVSTIVPLEEVGASDDIAESKDLTPSDSDEADIEDELGNEIRLTEHSLLDMEAGVIRLESGDEE
jgi:4-amino-4-deoxy-L-arabinose transferase-like glycosyltransferase